MNKKLLSSLLVALAASSANAESVETAFQAGVDLYSDSDDMSIDKWKIGARKGHDIFHYKHDQEPEGEMLWSVDASKNSIDQDTDDDYKGYSIGGTVGTRVNDIFSAEIGLGSDNMENQRTGKNESLTRYQLKGKARVNEQVNIQASHKRHYLFDHGIVQGDDGKLVHGDTTDLNVNWRVHEKLRASGGINNRDLSDGNGSQKVAGSLMYGISPGWPWIWAGVKAEKLEYDQDKNSYWTPEEFTSYGLTAESSFAINEALNMNLGANLSRNKEDSNPSGTGYSVSAGADWKVADNISLNAKGYLLESTQESSEWKQDGINLSVNMKSF